MKVAFPLAPEPDPELAEAARQLFAGAGGQGIGGTRGIVLHTLNMNETETLRKRGIARPAPSPSCGGPLRGLFSGLAGFCSSRVWPLFPLAYNFTEGAGSDGALVPLPGAHLDIQAFGETSAATVAAVPATQSPLMGRKQSRDPSTGRKRPRPFSSDRKIRRVSPGARGRRREPAPVRGAHAA